MSRDDYDGLTLNTCCRVCLKNGWLGCTPVRYCDVFVNSHVEWSDTLDPGIKCSTTIVVSFIDFYLPRRIN